MGHAVAARNCALAFAAVVLVVTGCLAADSASSVFRDKCSSCHATDGSGTTSAGRKMQVPDFHSKQLLEMSDQEMFETIGRGKKHRAYPHSFLYTGLSEQQVRDLVAHIRQLQKK